MNRFLACFIIVPVLFACTRKTGDQPLEQLIRENLEFCSQQYMLMAESLPADVLPRSIDMKTSELVTSGSGWWTSGFYPGSLWYLFEYSGDSSLLEEAVRRTELIRKEQYNTGTHDLGFMLNNSFGHAYRLTGDTTFRDVLITGAQSLASRYNDTVASIRSWDHGDWKFPVIIDNMMNLEYLYRVAGETGDSGLIYIAENHTATTIRNHFREDFSSYHVVDYDPSTGEVFAKKTHQGTADQSAWARGQAWALYGFTSVYRETGNEQYLDVAKNIASFIMNHPNLPDDGIPYWDFDAPGIPDTYRDASAGAIICSALLELQEYVDEELSGQYIAMAEKQIRALSSDAYRATPGENDNFILKHGVGHLPGNSEVDVPLTYGDYYYIEAMLRMLELLDPGM